MMIYVYVWDKINSDTCVFRVQMLLPGEEKMDEDMGWAGREEKNNGRNKRICGGNDVENETMRYQGEVWTERQMNERNRVNVITYV